jgi:hypothetical protein
MIAVWHQYRTIRVFLVENAIVDAVEATCTVTRLLFMVTARGWNGNNGFILKYGNNDYAIMYLGLLLYVREF